MSIGHIVTLAVSALCASVSVVIIILAWREAGRRDRRGK